MKFRFKYYAQYRMYKREISTIDIKDIINKPDFQELKKMIQILRILK